MNLKYIHFNDFKHNGWHCRHCLYISITIAWKKEFNNSNNIRDVKNYLKKGFRLEWGICLQYRGILRQIPWQWWTNWKKLRISKKIPLSSFINQSEGSKLIKGATIYNIYVYWWISVGAHNYVYCRNIINHLILLI